MPVFKQVNTCLQDAQNLDRQCTGEGQTPLSFFVSLKTLFKQERRRGGGTQEDERTGWDERGRMMGGGGVNVTPQPPPQHRGGKS